MTENLTGAGGGRRARMAHASSERPQRARAAKLEHLRLEDAARDRGASSSAEQKANLVADQLRAIAAVSAITQDRTLRISACLLRFSESILQDRVALTESLVACESAEELEALQARLASAICERHRAVSEQLVDLVTQAVRDISDRACSPDPPTRVHGTVFG